MKTEKYILNGLIVLIIVVLVLSFTGVFSKSTNNNNRLSSEKDNKATSQIVQTQSSEDTLKSIVTGSTEPGSASIELTPHKPADGQIKVDYAINTHSVTLSKFNLQKITELEVNGIKNNPINAPALQGHHNSGTLIFPFKGNSEKFKITIKGIPNVENRTFNW